MTECIDREAAIKAIYESDPFGVHKYFGWRAMDIEEALRAIPADDVAPVRQWISVKDRLPVLELVEAKENDVDILRCLAFIKNRRAQNGAYVGQAWFDGEYFIDSDCIILDVTHWMPLPEPPKEEK